jgi:1-acyl-sn-glycerol-3-phosphate acyltransferase
MNCSQGVNLTPVELIEQDPRDDMTFVFHETIVRKTMVVILGVFLKAFMVLHVEGLENLPEQGACVLAANHLSNMDVFPIQLALPRPLFFMGKAELFRNPFIGGLARQLGAFPVQRGVSDQWAMDHSRKVLDKELVLAMFPEGTRSRGKGLSVAKTGAARLALEKNVPIIPLAIRGSSGLFNNFSQRAPVYITVCAPIQPNADDDPLSLTDQMMFSLASQLPLEMRGVYSEMPSGFRL